MSNFQEPFFEGVRAWLDALRGSVMRGRPSPRHLFIILAGVTANLIAVSMGLHGVLGLSWPIAIAGALVLSLLQTLIFEEVFHNGFMLGLAGGAFYAIIVSINIVLAAGGITAAFGADGLGQSTFRESIAQPLAAIHGVTSQTNDFAAAMGAVATHSAQQHRIEVAQGNTCNPSPRGDGPFSRLREDDAAMFDEARQMTQEIATEGQRISTGIDSAIANYRVARHHETVRAIGAALNSAQQLARDPRMTTVRARLQQRAAQIASGRPDRENPALRVFCPRDTMLRTVVEQALAIPATAIPPNFDVPPVPSESSSVWGLISALGGFLFGDGGNLGPWRFSIMFAPVPDGFFIFGLLLYRRQLKTRRTHNERLAEALGLPRDCDAEAAVARALEMPRLRRLYASHVRTRGWVFRLDYLVVPMSDEARRHVLSRMDGMTVFDSGIWSGSELPLPANGFDPAESYQLFALAKGVWARMEADEIQAALAELDRPPPEDPSPLAGAANADEKAA